MIRFLKLKKLFSFVTALLLASGFLVTLADQALAATVTLSGHLKYPDGSPIGGQSVSIGSGDTGANIVTSTDSSGFYSVSVPEGNYYSISFERLYGGTTGNVPASFSAWAQSITVQGDTSVDIQLPAAHIVTFHVTDSAGNPLVGATVGLGSGAAFGTNSVPAVSTQAPAFSSGMQWRAAGSDVVTDSRGDARMLAWDFPAAITAYFNYRAAQGFTVGATSTFIPDLDRNVVYKFGSFAEVESKGSLQGQVVLQTEGNLSIDSVSSAKLPESSLPDGLEDLSGALTFNVVKVPVGETVTLDMRLPSGALPTNVFKLIAGQLLDITSSVDISGSGIRLTIADGQLGDEDGQANGSILDPVVFARKPSNFRQAPTPKLVQVESLDDGFSFLIQNFDASAKYTLALDKGTAALVNGLVTVHGLSPEQASNVTVTVAAAGLTDAFSTIKGQAKGVAQQIANSTGQTGESGTGSTVGSQPPSKPVDTNSGSGSNNTSGDLGTGGITNSGKETSSLKSGDRIFLKILKNPESTRASDIRLLSSKQFSKIPASALRKLSTAAVQAISSSLAKAITKAQLLQLSVQQLAKLKTSAISSILPVVFCSLPVKKLLALTKAQVGSVTKTQKGKLSKPQLAALMRR